MKLSFALPLLCSLAVSSASCARYVQDLENAVDANDVHNARRAISQGVPVDAAITSEGVTALMLAAELGKVEMVNFLTNEAGASMTKVDSLGYNPLHFAAGPTGSSDGLRACLAFSAAGIDAQELEQGNTPLHFAAANGSLEKVVALVAAGANFEIKNRVGNTAIIAACYRDNVEVLEFLLSRGADYLEVNNGGQDCLAIAASKNCLGVARVILDRIVSDRSDVDRNNSRNIYNTGIIRAISYARTQEMRNLLTSYLPESFSYTIIA